MSTKPIDAAVARLVRVLRSEEDIRRGIRVDQRIANDGNVILDDDLGLIRIIENVDAANAAIDANTISLIDKLTSLGQPITRDLFSSPDGTLLTNHTGLDGATWTSDGGQFAIHNGRIYGTTTGVVYSSGIPESADYHVGAQWTVFNSTGENSIGIRVQPGATTGYFLYYNFGAFRLFRLVNGVQTNLGNVTYASPFPVNAGITITGSKVQLVINGAVRLTVTDTAITAKGRPGLRSIPITTTTGQHLDKFYAARVPLVTTAQLGNEIDVVNSEITDLDNTKAATTYVNSEIQLKTPSARILASDNVTTSTTATGIGTSGVAAEYMIFSVGAFQEWRIDAYLECSTSHDGALGGNAFDGAKFGIAIPTGATLIGTVIGWGDATNRWFPFRWAASGLNSVFWMIDQSAGRIEIHATIKTGATTGFMVVQAAVVVADGDQLTILSGSWANAQRIINTEQGIE